MFYLTDGTVVTEGGYVALLNEHPGVSSHSVSMQSVDVRCPIRVQMHRYQRVIVRLDKFTVLCLGNRRSASADLSLGLADPFDCMDE